MRRRLLPALLPLLLLAGALSACGEGDLEVQGKLNRVVGETVTLELTAGEDDFTGKLELVGSDRTKYAANKLNVSKKNARKLTFRIPGDVAPGKATARAGRDGSDQTYDVGITVNRLALTMDGAGILEILPLPPTAMAPSNISPKTSGSGLMALSPTGGLLALFASDKLRLMSMGATLKDISAPINQKGATCLVALNDGMLVGTATQVIYLKRVASKGITRSGDFSIPGCTDISVDGTGSTALVLSRWDSSGGNGNPDSDALTQLSLGSSSTAYKTLKVDGAPGASAVSLAGDGKTAVITDGPAVYGVTIKGSGQFAFSQLHWGFAAVPVSATCTSTALEVSGQSVYVHAVAESSRNQIRFVAHDRGSIKWVYQEGTTTGSPLTVDVTSQGTPAAISFGRRLELYLAADKSLYKISDVRKKPTITALGLTTANKITSLAVQP